MLKDILLVLGMIFWAMWAYGVGFMYVKNVSPFKSVRTQTLIPFLAFTFTVASWFVV